MQGAQMNQVKIEEIANKLGRITRFEMSFVNMPSSQAGQKIEKAVGYIRTDEETVALLQQNIPRILNSRKYFDAYAEKIAELYHFIVDKEHLRKKLKLFLQESYRKDSVRLAQRLIRGKFTVLNDEKWLWLGGRAIASLSQILFAETKVLQQSLVR
jgi:hypothetical protein